MFDPEEFVRLWSRGEAIGCIARKLRMTEVNVRQRATQLRARGVRLALRSNQRYTAEYIAGLNRIAQGRKVA